jgi:DNA-directed RNA polymerase subunit alpha
VSPVTPADQVLHLWGLRGDTTISVRAQNCLLRAGVQTVASLLELSAEELRDIRNFGEGCLGEVRRVLAQHGLALRDEEGGGPHVA